MWDKDRLFAIYSQRCSALEELSKRLERETEDALGELPHVDRISFRVKSPDSFVNKALDPRNEPPYGNPFTEIDDQVAGRVIVFFLPDIDAVQKQLEGTFNLLEKKERRPSRDEEFGYESCHLISMIPPHLKPVRWKPTGDMPKTFELQIRTIFMHAWAEPQHDIGYKGADDLPRHIRRELAWIAASAWGSDQAYKRICEWKGRQATD